MCTTGSPAAPRTRVPAPRRDAAAAPGQPRPRRRPALSPSRAVDFRTCPLLYRYRAIDRLPELPGRPQVRGTLVHAVLERLFALPAAERTREAATAMVGPAWVDLVISSPGLADALFATPDPASVDPAAGGEPLAREPDGSEQVAEQGQDRPVPADAGFARWLASVHDLVEAYFVLEDPAAVEAESVELLVETELGPALLPGRETGPETGPGTGPDAGSGAERGPGGGLLLRGFVDRIDVLPGGGLRVVDYKTGRIPQESGEAAAMFQLKFYALALLQLRGTVPDELRLLYLPAGQWLSYSPDADELRRFARVLDALWTAIRTAGREGDFPPRRSGMCRFCRHRERCPEWGGTPPPYPGWPSTDEEPLPDDG
ncbi:RecB family exonuclease [Pseudonocardia dioxanivorans CB1190]|uniref:RecB family exonuclease n=1 Tax=Pseudonocardia dioxanivorans (strain ATCC 55486 / DSM 44775 / JCM 13855 / CB1190) TaxID=675635 RepID=F4CX70_PSEUX|nr:RecB family exonuclease [Pseudonocardia dioxanivorans CB1190]